MSYKLGNKYILDVYHAQLLFQTLEIKWQSKETWSPVTQKAIYGDSGEKEARIWNTVIFAATIWVREL